LIHGRNGCGVGFVLVGTESLGGREVHAAVRVELIPGQKLLDGGFGLERQIGVLVELGLEALDLAEALDEGGAGVVAAQGGHGLGHGFEVLRFHEVSEFAERGLEFLYDLGSGFHQPDLFGLDGVVDAGEEDDGGVHGSLLLAEFEDLAVRFGGIEDAIGAGEGLD